MATRPFSQPSEASLGRPWLDTPWLGRPKGTGSGSLLSADNCGHEPRPGTCGGRLRKPEHLPSGEEAC